MEPLSANDPRMIGEFRLHARLGAGGMGQVYLGFSPAGHAVAIKVIHPQFARDQEFLRRFSHEVAAASAVGGMYTAPVVDYDLTSETPWLATAYVPGPTLATVINRHGALPEAALWRLAAGLAEALRAVHAKGLVHRDLKPANVLLADSGPHVIDFGISRASSSMTQLTSAGMAIGTPGYMSPEQAQVDSVGPPSDLFSLGCVLAYAATGTPPFHGENPAAVLFRIVSAEPDLSAASTGFRQVIQACLKKNPAERPTPGQLIAMIGQLGPATPATLGSFWPQDVARIIADEQATQAPSGRTRPAPPAPPAPFAGATSATGSGMGPGMSGAAGHSGLMPPGPTAAASASALGQRPSTVLAAAPNPGQATGHAPMIADGYYAAAQQSSQPAGLLPGPSAPSTPTPPQSYNGQRPYVSPQPGGQQPHPGRQPSLGQQPVAGNPLPQYAPGRRNPMTAEVPQAVQNAIKLMYAGLAVTVLDLVLTLIAVGRYDNDRAVYKAVGKTVAAAHANSMAGAAAVGAVTDFLGLACWIWLALATRRGQGWPRVAGAVLLVIYAIITLFVVFGTGGDPAAKLTTIVVWALGLASLIPLRSQQARDFFFTWRKR